METRDRTPMYARIAADLRTAIQSGELVDGDRLPGENALMHRYGVARMTARHALATLRYEGLAVSRKGSGVFVRMFKPIRRHGSRRLARSLWGEGGNIWAAGFEDRAVRVDHLVVDRVQADEQLAEQLAVPVGSPLLRRSRRYLVDDRPVQRASSYLPLDLVEGTPITHSDTGSGGVFARLAELGHAPAEFSETLTARMPTPEEVTELEVPPGTPVVEITRFAVTTEGRTVDVTWMLLDASCHVLQYDFSA